MQWWLKPCAEALNVFRYIDSVAVRVRQYNDFSHVFFLLYLFKIIYLTIRQSFRINVFLFRRDYIPRPQLRRS